MIAIVGYGIFTIRAWRFEPHTIAPYFNYLADAFLHGQLHLFVDPPYTQDLSFFNGNYYLYWPPMPAILLIPFVAIWGVYVSDYLFTIVVAALGVAVTAQILRVGKVRGLYNLSSTKIGLLVVSFAYGSVLFTIAPLGMVWQTALVTGYLFAGLAYLSALSLDGRRAFLFTGLALAAAFLSRNNLILVGIWPVYELIRKHLGRGWGYILSAGLIGIAPLAIAVLFMAIYNFNRFGSAVEVGITYHLMHEVFVQDYNKYGYFNVHYLPRNLFYHFLAYPFPLSEKSFEGGSLFLLSPVFLGLFWGLRFGKQNLSRWILLLTIVVSYIPMGFLMGTGYSQWGPRYMLDFHVPILLLTAVGIEKWNTKVLGILVYISCLHYLIGILVYAN